MKAHYILILLLLAFYNGMGQAAGRIKDVQGQSVSLDSVTNKKILIVVLPAKPDTAMIGQLQRFQDRHVLQVKIVGVVSAGTAGKSGGGASYDRLATAGVILTEGMAVGDSANSPKLSVLKYISNRSRNRQVDRLAEGSKYFLSESGRLYAQLGGNISLDSRVADYILQTNVPGEAHH